MPVDLTGQFPAPCLRYVVTAGANANTNIPITGIKTTDVLKMVVEFVDSAAAATAVIIDRGATTTITSDGNIQCTAATNTTANHRLLVVWIDTDVVPT